MDQFNPQRRQVFQALIALSAVGGLSACGSESQSNEPRLAQAAAPGYFTNSEMALISAFSQTLIPQTETAGAAQVGVPAIIQSLATDWGDDAYRIYWREGLAALGPALTSQTEESFLAQSSSVRNQVLATYDEQVFSGAIENQFYRDFKNTVVQAYFRTETGATEELAYEPVPGEWIGCVPLSEFPKTWAT
ncbi:MAG: gluconate 2-dehydrogenase subunit 3 family protein [Henriciella sp.]|nr:gluconate 2-dehydrogenase subunit 3 family protein [Henriciella sp.]